MSNSNRIDGMEVEDSADVSSQSYMEPPNTIATELKTPKTRKLRVTSGTRRTTRRTTQIRAPGRALKSNEKSSPSARRRVKGRSTVLSRNKPGKFKAKSPTPPTRVVRWGPGNRYTDEDKEFFRKTLAFELKQNEDAVEYPNILAKKLAKKVRSPCR